MQTIALGFDRMVAATKRRPVYADIEALSEGLTGEIIAGELIVSPRPALRHAKAAAELSASLIGPFSQGINGPGGWHILMEPELHLGIDEDYEVLVPDLAGWRHDRMPSIPETAHAKTVPNWICEILSPRTAAMDRAEKMPFYARAKVEHLWLIDTALQTLEVFRLHGDRWTLTSTTRGEKNVRAEPFADLQLDLKHLWVGIDP